jgi:hypothetical protein
MENVLRKINVKRSIKGKEKSNLMLKRKTESCTCLSVCTVASARVHKLVIILPFSIRDSVLIFLRFCNYSL